PEDPEFLEAPEAPLDPSDLQDPPQHPSDSQDPPDPPEDFLEALESLPDPSEPQNPSELGDASDLGDASYLGDASDLGDPPRSPRVQDPALGNLSDYGRPRSLTGSSSSSLPSVSNLLASYERLGWEKEPPIYARPPREPTGPHFSPENQAALEEGHRKATEPILAKERVKKLLAFSRVPVPEKRIHPRQAALFTSAANEAAKAFISKPKESTLLRFLLLPRVLGLGLAKGNLAATLKGFPSNLPTLEASLASFEPTEQQGQRPPKHLSPSEQATKQLERGFLGRAAKALIDSSPLAPETPETLALLREKHPLGPKNPFNGKTRPYAGQRVTLEAVSKAVESIGLEKAPGLSGWTRPLLDLAIGKDSQVLAALRLLADMIRQGTAPGIDILCPARLIGLEKPDGGARPIAVGDLIYRAGNASPLAARG
ncbi:Uncharacterized protein TPAR_08022, partial [Tolypocladium paradoxum]